MGFGALYLLVCSGALVGLYQFTTSSTPLEFIRYGRDLRNHRQVRAAALVFIVASIAAAGVASFLGAMIDKYAPVQGGSTIQN
jgi:hypothetical protein